VGEDAGVADGATGWLGVVEPVTLGTPEVAGAGLVGVAAQPASASAATTPTVSMRHDWRRLGVTCAIQR
jgi:hypothetical protein